MCARSLWDFTVTHIHFLSSLLRCLHASDQFRFIVELCALCFLSKTENIYNNITCLLYILYVWGEEDGKAEEGLGTIFRRDGNRSKCS